MPDPVRTSLKTRLALAAILGGLLLGVWAVTRLVAMPADPGIGDDPTPVAEIPLRPTALPPALPATEVAELATPLPTLPPPSPTASPSPMPSVVAPSPTAEASKTHPVERVMAAVDYWAALTDEVSSEQLQALWRNAPPTGSASAYKSLVISPDVQPWLTSLWGAMASGAPVTVVSASEVVTKLWTTAGAVGILPFDLLQARLKTLRVNGVDILERDADLSHYPLRLMVQAAANEPETNRDPQRITRLIMTGTTALTRTTAQRMERYKDYAWPARKIAPVLAAADITHVSNEVPFLPGCQVEIDTMKFCSKPEYMATFTLAGVNIVGLTGNHEIDFGNAAMLQTLDLYYKAGIKYYGGGRNLAEAAKPLVLTDHGNRLAFLGANQWGPPDDWADAKTPGAWPYDPQEMAQAIKQAHTQADLVFVELQWVEEYQPQPLGGQVEHFRMLSDAGADVVTGVHAHQPQSFEFRNGRQILYGLGNLFFDQMWSEPTRQGLVVRHTIYAGKLLSSELLVTIIEDFGQPRWATPAERAAILKPLYAISGW